jgi:hypothetical protein
MLEGRVRLQDFVFAKEVRMGSYAQDPPAAIVAKKVRTIAQDHCFLHTYSLLYRSPKPHLARPLTTLLTPLSHIFSRRWPVILAPSHAWGSVWPTWR